MKSPIAAILLFVIQGLPPMVGPLIPDTGGVVTGIVRRTDSGGPVAEAQVAVLAEGDSIDRAMTRATLTDLNGRFTIRSVPPGSYTVFVQGEGFFGPSGESDSSTRASKDVQVAEGSQTDTGILKLLPGATISGRIYGADSQPVGEASVQALKASYLRGRLAFTPVKTVKTDDLGEYRLFWLPPGDYYIRAQYRSSERSAERYAGMFFPGIAEEDAAPSVSVRAGAEISGIDFRVPATPTIGVTIKGQISGAAEDSDLRVSSVYVVPRDRRVLLVGDDIDVFQNQAGDTSQGRFEIRNVPPGEYNLFPMVRDQNGRNRTTSILVDVSSRAIEGIAGSLEPGFDLAGRVTLDGKAGGGSVLKDSLQWVPVRTDPGSTPLAIAPKPDTGEFTLNRLPPGKYVLHQRSGFRELDTYIADVRRGETSVFDEGVTIGGEPGAPLEILLKSRGGTVSGVVSDPTRLNPFPYATVVLIPEPARRQNFALYKHALTSDTGKFSFAGVPPGEYKLFSWASPRPGAWENALFLEKFEGRGTPVTITSGAESTILLTVIP